MNAKTSRWKHEIRIRAVAHTIVVLLLSAVPIGCAAPSGVAILSATTLTTSTAAQNVDAQVQEDGLLLNGSVSLQGLKGQTVEVAAYHDDTFLGVTEITPDQDNVPNQNFGVFVPASKLYNLDPPYDMSLFVTDAADPDHFLCSQTWNFNDYRGYQIEWDFVKLEENVDLGNGARGIRITTNLNINGYKDQSFICSVHVQDKDQKDFSDDLGGPISINVYTITPTYDSCQWENLVLTVPYSRLSALPPTQEITLTPVLAQGSNIYTGTIHISALAGGTAEDVKADLQKKADDNAAQIASLERQIQKLNQELKQ